MAVLEWPPLADHIEYVPSPNKGYGDVKPRWRAVTWHIAEGSLNGTIDWLCSPQSQASSHVVIGRNGEIFNLVPLGEAAWCQGRVDTPDLSNPIIRQTVAAKLNPNLVSFSIECVGYSTWGRGGSLTDPQRGALERVTAYLCYRAKLTADRVHILGHNQWDSRNRWGCPGFSPAEWGDMVARVAALTHLWRGW